MSETIKTGDAWPSGVEFKYIPINPNEPPLACSVPILLKLDDQIAKLPEGGNIAIVSVPGAFTPTCTENHIPPFLQNLGKLRSDKKINLLIILSANDAFVLNAWGKLLLQGISDYEGVVFASDPNAQFAQAHGLSKDASAVGFGIRTSRFALVISKDKLVKYLGIEEQKGVSVSGYDAVYKARL